MLNKSLILTAVGLTASACLMLAAPLALANDQSRVNWSISIGAPYPPPVVYVQPQPIYMEPAPVYVRPRPVYVAPAPVVEYRYDYYDRPYHGDEYRRHERRGHHDDDD